MGLPRWYNGKRICLPVQELQETQVWSLGQEDPLEKEMATHSSILAWKSHRQRSLTGYTVRGVTKNRTQLSEHKKAPRIWKTKQLWVLSFSWNFSCPRSLPWVSPSVSCLQIWGSKEKLCSLSLSCLSIPLLPGLGDASSKDKTDWALARQLVTTHFHFPWKEKLVSFMLADFWVKWN